MESSDYPGAAGAVEARPIGTFNAQHPTSNVEVRVRGDRLWGLMFVASGVRFLPVAPRAYPTNLRAIFPTTHPNPTRPREAPFLGVGPGLVSSATKESAFSKNQYGAQSEVHGILPQQLDHE